MEKAIAYITDSTETKSIVESECKLLDSVIEDGCSIALPLRLQKRELNP